MLHGLRRETQRHAAFERAKDVLNLFCHRHPAQILEGIDAGVMPVGPDRLDGIATHVAAWLRNLLFQT